MRAAQHRFLDPLDQMAGGAGKDIDDGEHVPGARLGHSIATGLTGSLAGKCSPSP
jgi:hypothetical protein